MVLPSLTWFLFCTQGGGGGAVILEPAEAPSPSLAQLWPRPLAGLLHNLFDVLFWFPPPPQYVGEPLPFTLFPWPGVSEPWPW